MVVYKDNLFKIYLKDLILYVKIVWRKRELIHFPFPHKYNPILFFEYYYCWVNASNE